MLQEMRNQAGRPRALLRALALVLLLLLGGPLTIVLVRAAAGLLQLVL